jgi:2-polyprenyl-3-methyl-5-hydroxy-6-metoxy-1,4-benzoquinol methylase
VLRNERLLSYCHPLKKGLEVGPLSNPLATKERYPFIKYVDYASREELSKASSHDPNVDVHAIPDIDHICRSIDDYFKIEGKFDFVLASHVIEHVPDIYGWINAISFLLWDHAKLILAVPDKRYCFDYFRHESTIGECLEAFWEQRRKPSVRQVFDAFSLARNVNTQQAWEQAPGKDTSNIFNVSTAYELAKQSFEESQYRDCHCWVFTYGSFLELIDTGNALGLIDLRVLDSSPPIHGANEFHVVLSRK